MWIGLCDYEILCYGRGRFAKGDVIEEPGDASRVNHSWGRNQVWVHMRALGSLGVPSLSRCSPQCQVSEQGGMGDGCSPADKFRLMSW
jgi:hypothetical protein